ncbi:type-F conjugative transfer system pilin assembly thiol-disulfide isomerase TrbB [Testudinibacter sp. TR-2022]|uniref:type-F conjugative transfer system pilin assembly thiol-disulfide isomerase TrbB n=1 Tax=Testudinibacter sp. TR-2022 TaxID=2585029 RepID=UPI001117C5CE|nr:type-F conjugative transfer system pilin assembly thiol-disulfide isomerase TrbB [Testudinibacter sp. TR-2022]TNH04048.1 type-F conjugative transfer system pilin assembly thiol-disulfide isomerase TrbB [Pasteurellaceae bacterium Phil31]TNH10167.1 type-F conjugative transfer system pilin assembly thiol-disulfide isomerase TrbB [Testudinibacter sp. TR-2022]TNH13027.1 type-F conjugative transfer system pilin assembly thiol-disulfide isomerase TrbB [Testudinibacter sp. TR-2022]
MKKYIVLFGLFFSQIVAASSTLDQIRQLEAHKNSNAPAKTGEINRQAQTKKVRNYIHLSNGKQMDISDWQIVHFMSSTCSYCRQFNPVLKNITDTIKMPVFTYSFDGIGDDDFPNAIPVNKAILDAFFAELPQATPTDFLVNVNTLETLPLSQGALSYESFLQRLDEVFVIIDNMRNEGILKR